MTSQPTNELQSRQVLLVFWLKGAIMVARWKLTLLGAPHLATHWLTMTMINWINDTNTLLEERWKILFQSPLDWREHHFCLIAFGQTLGPEWKS